MKNDKAFRKRFLVNSEDTGRFLVKSLETGATYFVESMGRQHTQWSDLNPATGKIEGGYGDKYKGSITESESMITPENGFEDIKKLDNWSQLMAEIERRDQLMIK